MCASICRARRIATVVPIRSSPCDPTTLRTTICASRDFWYDAVGFCAVQSYISAKEFADVSDVSGDGTERLFVQTGAHLPSSLKDSRVPVLIVQDGLQQVGPQKTRKALLISPQRRRAGSHQQLQTARG
jgi:hypothetical protein